MAVVVGGDVNELMSNPDQFEDVTLQIRLLGSPDVLDQVQSSVRSYFADRGWTAQTETPVGDPQVQRTATGVALTVDWIEDTDEFKALLRAVAADLSRHGYSGVVSTGLRDRTPLRLPDPPEPAMTAALALNLTPAASGMFGDYTRGDWYGDLDATQRVLDLVLEWVGVGDGVLAHDAKSTLTPLPDLGTGRALILSELSSNRARVGAATIHAEGFRRVRFDSWGRVIVEAAGATHNWRAHLQELTGLIRNLAPVLRYAMIKRSLAPRVGYISLHRNISPEPPIGTNIYDVTASADERLVPDAFGVQLLGPGHLEDHLDLTRWNTEVIGDKVILSDRDPDAWFAPIPSAPPGPLGWDVRYWIAAPEHHTRQLEAARASLAPVIMTEDNIAQH